MAEPSGMPVPKPLLWQRMYVTAFVAEKLAQPTIDWLWERHHPDSGKRMIVTHASITEAEVPGVPAVHFIMEYTARGANKTDLRRKVWEALTMAAGTGRVMARVEAVQVATVRLDLGHYLHNDKEWLDAKIAAAREVADEIQARDWSGLEEDDDADADANDDAEQSDAVIANG